MAQEIQMFSYAGSHIEFNKTNLILALNEWFGGADGPQIVKVIANDFEKPCETEAQNENGTDKANLDKRKFNRIIM
ncbi:unnamed protein product [Orchesella dallaii]|uniref:Uncharacterized protein n=1 Tax=Orchesella dallaii TaxID=48710 RepID=A0ABP1R1T1_9HEXA